MFENRRLERFDLELAAKVEILGRDNAQDTQIIKARTRDICAGGAFIKTDSKLPEGAEVKVVLVMPLQKLKILTGNCAHIRVFGQVIRNTPEGFAIRFEPDYQIEPH